jgi:glycosyltransferase involved in cell wall biosynthesis
VRVLTIFTQFDEIHLHKDVGQISSFFSKGTNNSSSMLSKYFNTVDSKSINFIQIQPFFGSLFLGSVLHILSKFRRYDILIMYHLQVKNIFLLLLFKVTHFIINSKGITYLKLDANQYFISRRFSVFYKYLLNKVDFVSVESSYILENQRVFNDLLLVPNGFSFEPVLSEKYTEIFTNQENIFLVVGRIGAPEKNHQQLIRVFDLFCTYNSSWILEFVGPINPEFYEFYLKYNFTESSTSSRIRFIGEISDRKSLQSYYTRSKVLLSSSLYEGFNVSMVEALAFGCYIISSNVPCVFDITANYKYGCIFEYDDDTMLLSHMKNITDEGFLNFNLFNDSINYANDNFSWGKILIALDSLFRQKIYS